MAAVNNSYILARNSRLPIPSDTDGARKRVVIVGGGFTVRLNTNHDAYGTYKRLQMF
jgi:hypothetical protein